MRPQAAAMKALLDQPGLQIMPGCGDGMGARLIEEAGFRTGFISGSSISAMRLAMPDMDLLTFPEMADAIESIIAAAPNVLWLADGDTGYGNALAVQKTIPRLRPPWRRRGADRGQGLAAAARPWRGPTGDRARGRHPALSRRRRGVPRGRHPVARPHRRLHLPRVRPGIDAPESVRRRGRRYPISGLASI